ncbi:sulfatase family protein [Actinophytocola gossypii]|uniref:Sulfatase n=1 Tax=Actinophytocola gossypii TaxID=2812003 RepID=A0ABT2JGB3_9PSEU|nr:sulfatase [Actinophytocola gossypii]MCT2586911.1 sulfatase [Actinophytocola gossypii]
MRPNIVLLHGHDFGRWLPAYGMPSVPAPALTRFAHDSTVFDAAHATAPLCTPARGSLFTGLSPHRHGLLGLTHHGWRYRPGVTTLPELLRPLGYRTALVGLQHEDHDPTVLGFDEVHGLGFLPRALPVADEAVRWLRGRPGEPFLLTVGMWEAHRPWPAEDYRHADPERVDVPGYLPDNAHTRADIAAFHGALRQLDEAMGRVLAAVDRYTDPANTMVIVTTDHGAAFPGAKGTLYEPGTGVALMIRPPRSWRGAPSRYPGLVSHLDIAPTLLAAAGAAPPDELEGESLLPALTGAPPTDRLLVTQKTFHDGYDPIRAVRDGRHAYIRNIEPGPRLRLSRDLAESQTRLGMGDDHLAPRPAEELYDLAADPWERVNLAEDPGHAEVRAALSAHLDEWMRATGDPLRHGVVPEPAPAVRQGAPGAE